MTTEKVEGEKYMVKKLAVLLLGCASISSYAQYIKHDYQVVEHRVQEEPNIAKTVQKTANEPSRYKRELDCLINTTIREAENQDRLTQQGIMHVIHNRAKLNKTSYCNVVNKKNAFSHRKIHSKRDPSLVNMARSIMKGDSMDPTKGSLFFHDDSITQNPFKHTRRAIVLGDMWFYKLVGDYMV
jgi:hypothetical protein